MRALAVFKRWGVKERFYGPNGHERQCYRSSSNMTGNIQCGLIGVHCHLVSSLEIGPFWMRSKKYKQVAGFCLFACW